MHLVVNLIYGKFAITFRWAPGTFKWAPKSFFARVPFRKISLYTMQHKMLPNSNGVFDIISYCYCNICQSKPSLLKLFYLCTHRTGTQRFELSYKWNFIALESVTTYSLRIMTCFELHVACAFSESLRKFSCVSVRPELLISDRPDV